MKCIIYELWNRIRIDSSFFPEQVFETLKAPLLLFVLKPTRWLWRFISVNLYNASRSLPDVLLPALKQMHPSHCPKIVTYFSFQLPVYTVFFLVFYKEAKRGVCVYVRAHVCVCMCIFLLLHFLLFLLLSFHSLEYSLAVICLLVFLPIKILSDLHGSSHIPTTTCIIFQVISTEMLITSFWNSVVLYSLLMISGTFNLVLYYLNFCCWTPLQMVSRFRDDIS